MGYLTDLTIVENEDLQKKVRMAMVECAYEIITAGDLDGTKSGLIRYAAAVANNILDATVVKRFVYQAVVNFDLTTSSTEAQIKAAVMAVFPILATGFSG